MKFLILSIIFGIFAFHFAYGQESSTIILGQLTGTISIIPERSVIGNNDTDTINIAGNIGGAEQKFAAVCYENYQPRDGNTWLAFADGDITNGGSIGNAPYDEIPLCMFHAKDNMTGIVKIKVGVYDSNNNALYSNIAIIQIVNSVKPLVTPDSQMMNPTQKFELTQEKQKDEFQLKDYMIIFAGIASSIGVFFGSLIGLKAVLTYIKRSRPITTEYTPEGIVGALETNQKLRSKVLPLVCPEPRDGVNPKLEGFVEEIARRYDTAKRALPKGFEEDNK